MKLLLTSGGLTNGPMVEALQKLIGKPLSEAKIAVILLAKNQQAKDKSRVITQLYELTQHGFGYVDIVDPSARDVDNWRERLDAVDCIYVYGGSTFFLLDQVRKSGLDEYIYKNIDKFVYVGNSAGTILATPTIRVASMDPPDENPTNITDLNALHLLDFEIEPHCDDERYKIVEEYSQKFGVQMYAIDDSTAVKVDGDKIEVISEGNWKIFN
ncbi:MAG: Type 1 glutamine amidotransferase-like domain-containing protein [Patescibacteria group bacterium]